jgi:hypothetical protein
MTCSSETPFGFQRTARHYIAEDRTPHILQVPSVFVVLLMQYMICRGNIYNITNKLGRYSPGHFLK